MALKRGSGTADVGSRSDVDNGVLTDADDDVADAAQIKFTSD
jgi:hypothetical protein